MADIFIMKSDQAVEARQVIYTVAHQTFHEKETLEESLALYALEWPLHDLDDIQKNYFENGGTFLVACDGDRIIGTGALRRLEEKVGEIKRVWLLEEYHGQGLGYRMMVKLLNTARELGYEMVRLQTHPAQQERAFEFYKKLGFYVIPRYGNDPDDVGMELVL
jgi:putative acetyltransferase